MAIFHKTLQYHEDTTEKRDISQEDIEFLKKLQLEMNTQDTTGTADPRFWVIKGSERVINNEDPDELCLQVDGSTVTSTTEETVKYLNDNILPDCNIDRGCKIETGYTWDFKLTYTEDGEEEYDDLSTQEVNEFLADNGHDDTMIIGISIRPFMYPNTMFLTEKEAREHLKRNYYHYSEDAHTNDSDQIQERMMGNLPADISDMEGDFPYDFTMPTAIEISQLVQFNLVRCLMVAFPEYSWGDWMDLHGAEAGVTRKEAVAATGTVSVTAAYGTVLAAGTVFAVPATDQMEAVEFQTLRTVTFTENETMDLAVEAVTPGVSGNVPANTITIMASGKDPYILFGVEMFLGFYEVISNVILKISNHVMTACICYDCTKLATSVTSDYVECGYSIADTQDSWKYISELGYDPENPSVRHGTKVAASSSTGYADGQYTNKLDQTSDGLREWLSGGDLGLWSLAGRWCAYLCNGLGNSWWACAARLSASGRCAKAAA